jgi:hypothetical protein
MLLERTGVGPLCAIESFMLRWAILAAVLPLTVWGQRWEIQFFYDQSQTTLELVDLAFPSAERGVAVGSIYERTPDKKPKPVALITSDGGAHWTTVPLKDDPRSVFFLNDSLGWLVGEEGLWQTEESGRSWKKISPQKSGDRKLGPSTGLILKVWFLDPMHGFAVGYQKTVLETHDGGRTWKTVEEAAKASGNPAFTAYTQIAFADGKRGLIAGTSAPPRRDRPAYPAWMAPEQAAKLREQPTLTLTMETHDAGTWSSSTAPLFGFVSTLRFSPAAGLSVFTYAESFQYPSEVVLLNLDTGKPTTVFREPARRVTDALLFDGPQAYLAAVEPPGKLSSAPIPGKIKMLTSSDMSAWSEMNVDYRAVARTVMLAGPDAAHVWAGTDTGMILHLQTGK